jgi:hypothetical protein
MAVRQNISRDPPEFAPGVEQLHRIKQDQQNGLTTRVVCGVALCAATNSLKVSIILMSRPIAAEIGC